MSLRPDGSYECDRCGWVVGNGAVTECSIVSTLDPANPTMVLNLHFCRDHEDGGKMVKGCTSKVLTSRNVQHYEETHDTEEGQGA